MQPSDKQHTTLIFRDDARRRLLAGISLAAETIGCTMGPRGRTVLIQRPGSTPVATKDGVTVSRSIRLADPVEAMGADLVKEAANQTNETAGDGTTTASILTHAMASEGFRLLTGGYPAPALCRGISRGVKAVTDALKGTARPVSSIEEIAQVGTISANGDETIGRLIADAMDRVGRNGIVTVEDAKGTSTSLDVVEGMRFERGYVSPFFVTDNSRMHAFYDDCAILVTDQKISSMRELVPILEGVVLRERKKLLIIADELEGEALNVLVVNRVQQGLPVVAVKAPGYGDHRHALLQDICALTGAKLISSKTGLKLEETSAKDLGSCRSVTVTAKHTTLVGTGASKEELAGYTATLEAQLEDVTLSPESLDRLRERIARLSGGVAIIRVGGATEVEMVERKYRIEDALHATRAAADEGIVSGGGAALFDAANLAEVPSDLTSDELAGYAIVTRACLAPLTRIANNAGKSADVVIEGLKRGATKDDVSFRGWNAQTDSEVDMIAAGIVDPVKVTRTALENAASVATTFLLLDAVIFTENEENEPAQTR